MRPLRDYFLRGGRMSAIQTDDNASEIAVIADVGTLRSVIMNVHTLIDALTTFDVILNNVETGVDVTLPDATPAQAGVEMFLPSEVHVEIGDAIFIQSNGEQVAATTADLTFVIRR